MATTLQDLITYTRQRANIENNQFISDTELTNYINNSLAELDDILIGTYDDYKVSTFQSILQGGDNGNIIPIPSNFLKLRAVDYSKDGTTNWQTVHGFQLPERNRNRYNLYSITNPYTNSNISARLTDAGIIVTPSTYCAGKYQIWYVPKFIPLVDTTDTLTIQMDTQAWKEYAVVDSCIKILNKQNLDPSAFMAEKAALQQRVIKSAKNRNSAGPKRMANVRFNNMDDYDFPFGYNF